MEKLNREELLELKEFLTERMVDNMSTKDLEEYVANDLFNYFDKLGEHEFLEEARNYWDEPLEEDYDWRDNFPHVDCMCEICFDIANRENKIKWNKKNPFELMLDPVND